MGSDAPVHLSEDGCFLIAGDGLEICQLQADGCVIMRAGTYIIEELPAVVAWHDAQDAAKEDRQ